MKKIFCTLVLLGSLAAISYAQNNSIGTSDPDAKKILDAVTKKIKGYKAVQATFTLRIEDAKGNIQGSKKGTVYMKGNKYRVTITGQEIFCDGNNVWTYDKSANEVTLTKFDPSQNSWTPQKIFANTYDKEFLYKLNGMKKMGPKSVQEIEMTPVDKTKSIFKIYVYVDKSTNSIYSSKLLDKSGNVYVYTINSLNGKAVVNDATFVFDKSKYPGVEVVDLNN
ncbi:MAG TPA: outer membrane lipoprotein carrier protein LolA [Puia sp.]|nr:outer membrane lipoprotein carrier protein LolA [Puia sp.]